MTSYPPWSDESRLSQNSPGLWKIFILKLFSKAYLLKPTVSYSGYPDPPANCPLIHCQSLESSIEFRSISRFHPVECEARAYAYDTRFYRGEFRGLAWFRTLVRITLDSNRFLSHNRDVIVDMHAISFSLVHFIYLFNIAYHCKIRVKLHSIQRYTSGYCEASAWTAARPSE